MLNIIMKFKWTSLGLFIIVSNIMVVINVRWKKMWKLRNGFDNDNKNTVL